jgi:hypothetical protein
MESMSVRIRAMALTFALVAAPAAALAQTQTPTREGNIWGWRDHQPTEAQVRQDESAAGIAPTQSDQHSTATTVDQLYQQLLHRSPD